MRRAAALVAAAAAALAVGAGSARATNECRGFMTCVPVAGPWVVVPPRTATSVQYQLSCPKKYTVGGLDAELSSRAIDLGFLGKVGSPVNPGITTSDAAVFLARLLPGGGTFASFRPHIGCVPGTGGGERVPTAFHPFPPGQPSVRHVKDLPVTANSTQTAVTRCGAHERLQSATYALGFYSPLPPTVAAIRLVKVVQTVTAGRVRTSVHAGALSRWFNAAVQIDLVCGAPR